MYKWSGSADQCGCFGSRPDPYCRNCGEDRAERRQVTVMFADLVGSTAPSARMDPEDLSRGHFGLPEMRGGDRSTFRRLCGEVRGR